jgi:hypothetical protein
VLAAFLEDRPNHGRSHKLKAFGRWLTEYSNYLSEQARVAAIAAEVQRRKQEEEAENFRALQQQLAEDEARKQLYVAELLRRQQAATSKVRILAPARTGHQHTRWQGTVPDDGCVR